MTSSPRPILTHLNADTTWLLQIPIPNAQSSDKQYFTLLFDPWLVGPQSDVHWLFSTQWHVIPPAVDSLNKLEEVDTTGSGGGIDAVVVSHEFTDHCHQTTLMELAPSVPAFATTKAAELINSWKHFDRVYEIPPLPENDDEWPQASLPEWLNIHKITSTGSDLAYYHSGILISWPGLDGETEGLVYTPHGLQPGSLDVLNGRVKVLALLHGLHEVHNPWWLAISTLNLGAHKALESIRGLKPPPKYWIPTHDEVKQGGGLVSWVMDRLPWTLYDALEEKGFGEEKAWKMVNLGSGEKLVLE